MQNSMQNDIKVPNKFIKCYRNKLEDLLSLPEIIEHSYVIDTHGFPHARNAKWLTIHLSVWSGLLIIFTEIMSDKKEAILNCNKTQGRFVYHVHASCSLVVLYRFVFMTSSAHSYNPCNCSSQPQVARAAWPACAYHPCTRTRDNEVVCICFALWRNSLLLCC
jgi:hypothetical protein